MNIWATNRVFSSYMIFFFLSPFFVVISFPSGKLLHYKQYVLGSKPNYCCKFVDFKKAFDTIHNER